MEVGILVPALPWILCTCNADLLFEQQFLHHILVTFRIRTLPGSYYSTIDDAGVLFGLFRTFFLAGSIDSGTEMLVLLLGLCLCKRSALGLLNETSSYMNNLCVSFSFSRQVSLSTTVISYTFVCCWSSLSSGPKTSCSLIWRVRLY